MGADTVIKLQNLVKVRTFTKRFSDKIERRNRE